MDFCSVCDNMYYMKFEHDEFGGQLRHFCKSCGNETDAPPPILPRNNVNRSTAENDFPEGVFSPPPLPSDKLNEYTKYDPTIPHVKDTECPNASCDSNRADSDKDKKVRDILYVRYDRENMKYVYLCAICDCTWTYNR